MKNRIFFLSKLSKLILLPLLFIIVVFLLFLSRYFNITLCISKIVLGVPCPGCGMTRAWYSVIIDHSIKEALFYHPLFILPVVIFFILFFKRKFTFFQKLYSNNIFWLSLLIIILVVYIFRMFLYFPYNEPLKYFENSFLMKIINFLLTRNVNVLYNIKQITSL